MSFCQLRPTRTVFWASRTRRIATAKLTIPRRHASYVPPEAEEEDDVQDTAAPTKHPKLKTFFSGRSRYLETYYGVEQNVHIARRMLHEAHLYPLPKACTKRLPPLRPQWKDQLSMQQAFGGPIKKGEYLRLLKLLKELHTIRYIAQQGGAHKILEELGPLVEQFEIPLDQQNHLGKKRTRVDELGRCYAVGRRKTSSARVWIIKIQPSEETTTDDAPPPIASCLINGLPLSTYFPNVADRERVMRPLKVTGLLTSYNIFALARGGGSTGQAEAVALGMSKGLRVLEPRTYKILQTARLTRRDPRMVERKKTGLAKARKRYTWVKR